MIAPYRRPPREEKPVGPGVTLDASDRQYVTDKVPSTLRRAVPKVRGKAARAADKRQRQEARRAAEKRQLSENHQREHTRARALEDEGRPGPVPRAERRDRDEDGGQVEAVK